METPQTAGEPSTTIVIVPRETHSYTCPTIERVLAVTPPPFRLVVIDGGSPRRVQRRLRELADRVDATLIRRDALLSPVEARNLAMDHVTTELVAFVDNDTLVFPGWLASLERLLREKEAAVVMPVVVQDGSRGELVHFAGGVCHLETGDGGRALVDFNSYIGKDVSELDGLSSSPTENVELHLALASTRALASLGPFDEHLGAVRDDADLALRLQVHGLTAWIDAATRVVYPFPKKLLFGDLTFFRTRWSDEWSEPAFAHFNRKWDIEDHSLDDVFRRGHRRRRMLLDRRPRPSGRMRVWIWRWWRRYVHASDRMLTPVLARRALRRRRRADSARVDRCATWDLHR